jgi:hypothetical protein
MFAKYKIPPKSNSISSADKGIENEIVAFDF